MNTTTEANINFYLRVSERISRAFKVISILNDAILRSVVRQTLSRDLYFIESYSRLRCEFWERFIDVIMRARKLFFFFIYTLMCLLHIRVIVWKGENFYCFYQIYYKKVFWKLLKYNFMQMFKKRLIKMWKFLKRYKTYN